jgi:hypothetical protein
MSPVEITEPDESWSLGYASHIVEVEIQILLVPSLYSSGSCYWVRMKTCWVMEAMKK